VLRAGQSDVSTLVDALKRGGLAITSAGPVLPSLEDVFLDVVEQVAEVP
jgi:hypothetical protein